MIFYVFVDNIRCIFAHKKGALELILGLSAGPIAVSVSHQQISALHACPLYICIVLALLV